ncbi:MAG TPA: DNA (cytosine-5-)-methyltransferase [Nostocaceae cyanobacterium]|nr:DNA (cytosine-5-)-methyltransferase [Nostocaceae cyanobacterium]
MQSQHWSILKLEASVKRGYFRTVDLFAGCGGMSLGFHRAKYKCVAAIELNDDARESHEVNFSRIAPPEGYATYIDITKTSPFDAVSHLSSLFPNPESEIDILIGGPPCQAFSRLGRAALWDIAGQRYAHAYDERATMYHYFLSYLEALKPIAFVIENVREMGKFVGRNIAEEIAVTAEELGYETRYTLLNAVWYGVPQLRERMFLIGIHKELNTVPSFPKIQYQYDIPVGYSTSRAGRNHIEVLFPHDHYVDHYQFTSKVMKAVTAEEAFVDLPPIYHHLDGRTGRGFARDVNLKTKYLSKDNDFTYKMKNWLDFEVKSDEFTGHIIRYMPRDYEIFRRMPPGAMYPEALEIAKQIFQEKIRQLEISTGRKIIEESQEWQQLYKATVPPYKVHRYPNKFRKMWADQPARTVPAHIGKDSYSHIHFDSEQARGISLREAARLQSFPDAFKFVGSMNSQLTQIGNAVPPLLAYAVAKSLRSNLISAWKQVENNISNSKEHKISA